MQLRVRIRLKLESKKKEKMLIFILPRLFFSFFFLHFIFHVVDGEP